MPFQTIQTDFLLPTYINIDIKINKLFMATDVGNGDLTYNTKRNLLGAISLNGKTAYHLFTVDTNCTNIKESDKANTQIKMALTI